MNATSRLEQDPEPGHLQDSGPPASGWQRWLPGIETARRYRLAWLPHDLMAGLVLSAMLVPVGIAYAVASGVPGIHGRYATIIPLLAYALFGPSRILVLGPDSALATLILGTVLSLSAGDPARAVALAGMMALIAGLILILSGVLRLGFVTEILSKPIRYGYMNGIALTVIVSQIPNLFQVSIDRHRAALRLAWDCGVGPGWRGELGRLRHRRRHAGGDPPVETLAPHSRHYFWRSSPRPSRSACSGSARPRGSRCSARCRRACRLSLCRGSRRATLVAVVTGGIAIALVSFADTSLLSRSYAARLGTSVGPNKEMIGATRPRGTQSPRR